MYLSYLPVSGHLKSGIFSSVIVCDFFEHESRSGRRNPVWDSPSVNNSFLESDAV